MIAYKYAYKYSGPAVWQLCSYVFYFLELCFPIFIAATLHQLLENNEVYLLVLHKSIVRGQPHAYVHMLYSFIIIHNQMYKYSQITFIQITIVVSHVNVQRRFPFILPSQFLVRTGKVWQYYVLYYVYML